MAQKKETSRTTKPGVKMQDLAPKKDAKGGGGKYNPEGNISPSGNTSPTGNTSPSGGSFSPSGTGAN